MGYIRFDEADAAVIVPPLYVPGRRRSKGSPDEVSPIADTHTHLAAVHEALHESHEVDPELNPFVDA